MTILLSMNGRMTRATQRLEIIQRIVSAIFGRRNAVAVNVVNVQVILCAATLACVAVTLQSLDAVSAEAVVIFGLLPVLLYLVWVFGRPLSYSSDVRIVATWFAFALRSSGVFKWGSTVLARQHVTLAWRANGISLGSAILSAFDAVVFFFTSVTCFLRRAFWYILTATHGAGFWGKFIGFHMPHSKMIPNKYSGGAV